MNEDTPIPGLTPDRLARLDLEAPRAVSESLRAGRRTSGIVLHVEPDATTVEDRLELAARYRENGLQRLARRLERAVVPTNAVLVLVDADETGLVLMPLSSLEVG